MILIVIPALSAKHAAGISIDITKDLVSTGFFVLYRRSGLWAANSDEQMNRP